MQHHHTAAMEKHSLHICTQMSVLGLKTSHLKDKIGIWFAV